jgi:hypothetical protein
VFVGPYGPVLVGLGLRKTDRNGQDEFRQEIEEEDGCIHARANVNASYLCLGSEERRDDASEVHRHRQLAQRRSQA